MLSIFKIVGKDNFIIVNAVIVDASFEEACEQFLLNFFVGVTDLEVTGSSIGTANKELKPCMISFNVAHLEPGFIFDKKTPKVKNPDLLDTLIQQTELKARTKNVLHAADVFTLRDLIKHTESRMLYFYGVGPVMMNELKSLMRGLGISFKQE